MKCTTISFKTLSIVLILIPFILVGQKRDFPYALKSSDFIVIGVGLSSELIAKYRQSNQPLMTNDELIKLDRSDINKFDRSATYNWSNNLSKASNLTRTILVASPSILLLNEGIKKEWKNSLTYGVMYFEVVLVTSGLTDLTKSFALRKRPYLYNTNICYIYYGLFGWCKTKSCNSICVFRR